MQDLEKIDMQQNRNLLLSISLLVLTLATVSLFYFTNVDQSDFDKSIFKVSDQNKIDRVGLQASKSKIDLKFDGVKWTINTVHEADRQLVTVFFATILQAEPKRKLVGNQLDAVRERMKEQGIHVGLFEGNIAQKEFLVCGNEQKTETYFQLLGDDEIYYVTIPGYRVYVASIFELAENQWRDKRIFNFNWQNFVRLTAHFPANEKEDFSVSLSNGLFSIEEVAVADTTKLSGYLESVFNLRADRIVPNEEYASFDSLLNVSPRVSIKIEDISKRVISLSVYTSLTSRSNSVGKANDEIVMLTPRSVASVVKGRSYFVFK